MNKTHVLLTLIMFFSVVSCRETPNISVEMVQVEGGTFIMGHESVPWNQPREVFMDSFFIAKYPVTIRKFKEFLADTHLRYDWDREEPYAYDGKLKDLMPSDDCPAQSLSWYYAVAFCNWLSERDGLSPCYVIKGDVDVFASKKDVRIRKRANGYRLPTEAEWEYAARGGKHSKGYLFAGSDNPDEVAKTMQKQSYPIGIMKPNELGLYDMTGNVETWCWDWFDTNPGSITSKNNPSVDSIKQVKHLDDSNPEPMKVIRGMSWEHKPFNVYIRDHYPPQHIYWIGIRLVRNAD